MVFISWLKKITLRCNMQYNFHKQTGLVAGTGLFVSRYGKAGTVYGIRLGWSALTLTTLKSKT